MTTDRKGQGAPPAGSAPPGNQIARRETTALVPDRPMANVQELFETLAELQGRANVLAPVSRVNALPPMQQVSLRVVVADPNPDAGDVYHDQRFCKQGEVVPTKVLLSKLMAAAGVQIVESVRVDDGRDLYVWRWRVSIAGLDLDGTVRQVTATKELDLREQAPETLKPEWACPAHGNPECQEAKCNGDNAPSWRKTGKLVQQDPTAIAEKRRHGAANAETKALNRALREFFALPHKLTRAQLSRPFVVPKLVAHLDLSDPDVKRAYVDRLVWGERALTARAALPPGASTFVGETVERVDEDDEAEAEAQGVVEVVRVVETAPAAVEVVEEEPPPSTAPPREVPAKAKAPSCSCACGCGAILEEEQAKTTASKVGGPRCVACYPDERFDFKRKGHEDGKALGLPKYPRADAVQVRKWNAKRAEQ